MDFRKHIDSEPAVMLGKPKIVGTRITVELILRKISDGYDFLEILEMYPNLKREDILASIRYAAEVLESETVIPAS